MLRVLAAARDQLAVRVHGDVGHVAAQPIALAVLPVRDPRELLAIGREAPYARRARQEHNRTRSRARPRDRQASRPSARWRRGPRRPPKARIRRRRPRRRAAEGNARPARPPTPRSRRSPSRAAARVAAIRAGPAVDRAGHLRDITLGVDHEHGVRLPWRCDRREDSTIVDEADALERDRLLLQEVREAGHAREGSAPGARATRRPRLPRARRRRPSRRARACARRPALRLRLSSRWRSRAPRTC